jgi:hypothetical protein
LAEASSTGSPQTTYVYTRKSFTVYPTKLIGVYSGGNLVGTLHADSGAGVEATVLVETVLYDSYLNEIDTDTQYSNSASNGQNKEIDTNTQGGVGDCGRDTDYWVLNLMTVEADGESSQTAYADFREWVLWWATKALFGGWAEVEVLGDPTC